MPKYVIERAIKGAGDLDEAELNAISRKSCGILKELGTDIQWVESFVTPDKIYCVYIAPNRQLIEEHARKGGFPADEINEVKSVINPTTAEG